MSSRSLLLTGGTRGIGRAVALSQARAGTTLFLNYLRDDESAERTKKEAEAKGATAHVISANVGDPDAMGPLFDAIRAKTDRLDAIVHNAALGVFKPVMQLR